MPDPTRPSRLLARLRRPSGRERRRLVVLPPAGAGPHALGALVRALPGDVEVLGLVLPGREARAHDPLDHAADPAATLASLAGALDRLDPAPTTWFGHSLGGAVALAVRPLVRRVPEAVVVSCYPPGGGLSAQGEWSDAELVALMRASGTPEEVLVSREWRRHALRLLRADLTLGAAVAVPALSAAERYPALLVTAADDLVCTPGQMAGWRRHTHPGSSELQVPGGHEYPLVDAVPTALLDLLSDPGTSAVAA